MVVCISVGHSSSQPVILATGLQSSGSSLVSWCFLQRADSDGVLDGDTDLIPVIPEGLSCDYIWYKTTISSFTLEDLITTIEDEGFSVSPLLIVRDVRLVWASLAKKHYGRNGITAEDPPLRMRFRRFLRSWQYARAQDIPVIKFEDFVARPEPVLRSCCEKLGLEWDDAMLNWTKPASRISNIRHGNATFRQSDKQNLHTALAGSSTGSGTPGITREDLDWLEATFADFNQQLGYMDRMTDLTVEEGRLRPSWQVSRRLKWRLKQKPLRYLVSKLGLSSYQPRPE